MKKIAQGTIAAGAGLVLLLGGAGSLAYWNSQSTLDGGNITTGTLTLDVEDGEWAPEITTWVPGDSSTYTAHLLLVAEGDNIQGRIDVDELSITGDTEFFDITFDVGTALISGGSGSFDTATGAFSGPGAYTIPVEVTVSFPFGTEVDNGSKQASLDLAEIAFTATQTAVAP